MRRGPKPAKSKETKPSVARKSPKDDGARARDLEQKLAEARAQQAATAEILRVIDASPTDVQPVFDAIVKSAVRLLRGYSGALARVAGNQIVLAALTTGDAANDAALRARYPQSLGAETPVGQAIRDRVSINVADAQGDARWPDGRINARIRGFRSLVAVPLIGHDEVVGAIAVTRRDPGGFTEDEIVLLRTFADQAVIAIENVRLFKELQTSNRDLTTALDKQTATSDILRVISQSPTDVQPVFNGIVESARHLLNGFSAIVTRLVGEELHLSAFTRTTEAGDALVKSGFPIPLAHGSLPAQVVRGRAPSFVSDIETDERFDADRRHVARVRGYRSIVHVPMLREGRAIGTIGVTRPKAGPFLPDEIALLQTFADQAVIAIENIRLFTELQSSNSELTEALEQQTATSDILRVISSSPTDIQPVLEAVAATAARVCGATDAVIRRVEGSDMRRVAHFGPIPLVLPEVRRITGGSVAGRAILECLAIHVHDVLESDAVRDYPDDGSRGWRTYLAVPLVREGVAIGAIVIRRTEVRPFTQKQIKLLETFADQAVIAIENVRLFTELQASNRELTTALDTQTATSEILRVIASSPTDVQPVFDAIVQSATRLCDADFGIGFRFDGQIVTPVALHNMAPDESQIISPAVAEGRGVSATRATVAGRAVLDASVVHIHDLREDPEITMPAYKNVPGYRTVLAVPMLRGGRPIGSINVWRREIRPFSEQHIELLQTFADQAVIAIENVRLFKELERRNRELTQTLDQQTATSEILRVISSAHIDAQPVFDTIVKSAARLCHATVAAVFRSDGLTVYNPANYGDDPHVLAAVRSRFPRPVDMETMPGIAILTRTVAHFPDVEVEESPIPELVRQVGRLLGYRSVVAVPMLREGEAVGALLVARREPGWFSDAEVELLKTFGAQAVIAIENVHLFTELQARTQDLTRSVGQLTALGEVGRAVSSTLDVETVLSTIVSRAIQLSGTDGGSVYEYDEATEEFSLRASRDLPEAYVEQVQDTRPRKGEGAVGRVAETREPVQIADISDPAAYESRVRNTLLQIGLRALLAVPLIAEDHLVGALIVMRKRSGTFAAEEVALLQTFATQSALAIQNARLFREIEVKSRQLEVASQHKSEFLANMSHELRTPLNAIIGFSEVLSEKMFGELNDKQEEYSKDIHASGQHLLSLINDILDLSKIEAGRMELELTDFHLPTALDSALTLVRERAGRRSIALHTNIDSRLGQIQADERKVRQVVLNLLSNAIKFTPEGGRIEVGAVPKDGLVEVSVSDTGVGIAPEDQEAVFEEFRQVGTADKKVEGTGLGLTLCRKFVELHGGRIWLRSEVGIGSTFTFSLPLRSG